jgi:hypothetical protein
MTNREYLIAQLSNPDWIDDDGSSYEATVYYSVACPYNYTDPRALCRGCENDRDTCSACKEQWLDAEVDE